MLAYSLTNMFLSLYILSVLSSGDDLLAEIDSQSISEPISVETAETTEQHDVTVRNKYLLNVVNDLLNQRPVSYAVVYAKV